MGTQLIVGPMVVALAQQEEIVLRNRRQETVRVIDHAADAIRVGNTETVAEKRDAGQLHLEDPARVQ